MRGKGIGTSLYAYVEDVLRPGAVAIRTWSTNDAQLALLHGRGYRLVRTVRDDRGRGVDTLYFTKKLKAYMSLAVLRKGSDTAGGRVTLC